MPPRRRKSVKAAKQDEIADPWQRMLRALQAYKTLYDDTRVPERFKLNPDLSRWVQEQLAGRRKLSADQVRQLEKLGFWADHEESPRRQRTAAPEKAPPAKKARAPRKARPSAAGSQPVEEPPDDEAQPKAAEPPPPAEPMEEAPPAEPPAPAEPAPASEPPPPASAAEGSSGSEQA